jgi:mono/diheme cytochrome c family protein
MRSPHAVVALLLAVAPIASACHGDSVEGQYLVQIGGSPARGHDIIRDSGCAACHTVPGVREARGVLGPPLTSFGRRGYIAGRLPNRPTNLVRWIYDPPDVDPETVMPRIGLSRQQATDVAAYLYTLR